jgi:hypothetical protein
MQRRPKKLLDQVREAIRRKHYSIRTEQACVSWIISESSAQKAVNRGPLAVRSPLDLADSLT